MWPLVSGYLSVVFKNFFFFLSFLKKHLFRGMCNTVHVWRSEANLQASILSYCDVGPEDPNWVIRVGSKCLYLQFHHKEPHNLFSYTTRSQILEDRLFVPIPYVPRLYLAFTKLLPGFPVCFHCSIGSQNILPHYSKCSHSNTDVKKIL